MTFHRNASVETPVATQLVPQGHVRQCAVELIVDVFMRLSVKEMLATTLECTMQQIAEVHVVPDLMEENINVAALQESAQQRTVEQVVDFLVPQVPEEIPGMTSERVVEQIASVRDPCPQAENIEVIKVARQDRVQQRTVVYVTNASVLQAIKVMRELVGYTQQRRTFG